MMRILKCLWVVTWLLVTWLLLVSLCVINQVYYTQYSQLLCSSKILSGYICQMLVVLIQYTI